MAIGSKVKLHENTHKYTQLKLVGVLCCRAGPTPAYGFPVEKLTFPRGFTLLARVQNGAE